MKEQFSSEEKKRKEHRGSQGRGGEKTSDLNCRQVRHQRTNLLPSESQVGGMELNKNEIMASKLPDPGKADGQAEKAIRANRDSEGQQPGKEEGILHELRTYQAELEMQNEKLRQTQAELEAARAKYFDLYDLAPVGYFTISGQGVILEANLTAANLLGLQRNHMAGQPFTRLIAAEDQDTYYLFRKKLFETGAPQTCEVRMTRPDGVLIWVRLEATVAADAESGEPVCNIVMSDIMDRKKTEEEFQTAYAEMSLRVEAQTAELGRANELLRQEIENRAQAANSLCEALMKIEQLKDQSYEENIYLKEEFDLSQSHKDIVGNSEAIRTVLKQIEQVAGTGATVLIQGETGTGKELVANAIHSLSSRKGRFMIKVNCAALPPTLIESELFGREKGAFTGALSKQLGRFDLADTSTIFLDEVDSLPLELQAKLLRVLESGEFERLGSPRTVKIDIRIIAATNRDLAKLVSEGGFREDLYYRLNVFQITVPPLRERREDILPLIWSFVQKLSQRMGKRIESIPQKDVEALQAYSWPGNVRELRNVTERAMILTIGSVLRLDVPKIVQSCAVQSGTLEEVEKRYIIEVLDTTGWRVSGKGGAAEILGINPKTLESRLQRLGIPKKRKHA